MRTKRLSRIFRAALVCLAAGGLGWFVTPWVDGSPVLLSPAVRGVLRYAGQGETWMADLADAERLLLDALPVAGGDVTLPDPQPARVDPGTLLAYADRARRGKEVAVAVAKAADTTRPPEGLEVLHGAALNLAQSYAGAAAAGGTFASRGGGWLGDNNEALSAAWQRVF